ncbi:50S ribosomal protein L31 [Pandoraea thiooxydans]|nr:50S ribosomal protein L31 [Pandoraea thiooxydans]
MPKILRNLLFFWHNPRFIHSASGSHRGAGWLPNDKGLIMKEGIHPNYREVVFLDLSNDFSFKTRSTIQTKETIKWQDGNEYPLVKIEVSSESHPFYTGTQKIMDTAGRVEKFRQKFGNRTGKTAAK